jgi:chromosomal replication initiation ATPase DnaA
LTQATQANDNWSTFRETVRAGVSKGNWETWLSRLEPDFEGETLVLLVPSEFHLRWVRDKHGDLVAAAYRAVYGAQGSPIFRVAEDMPELPGGEDPVLEHDGDRIDPSTSPNRAANLIPRYRFESFVVGQSNRFAWAAAMAVAEQPGAHYNPLFIYGGAGLGKTHHMAGKQMVISSDRHPRNLSTLEDRLRSRFEWGLLTDIQPPDVETRLAILRRNAEFAPRPVPLDVLEHIAGLVSDNIRELEGALTRVTAWSALNRRDIDLETAARVLQDIVTSDEPVPLGPEVIIRTTANSYGFSTEDILSSSRRQPLVLSRQIAMYLCRELTDLSLPKIGERFNRDHTTVLHSVEKVKRILRSDRAVFDRVNQLTQELKKGGGVSPAR